MLYSLVTDFLEYCKVSCYSDKSMESLTTRTHEFNRFVNSLNIQSVQGIAYVHLLEYVANFEHPSVHIKKARVWMIRKFYSFLILHKIVKENIGLALPSPKIKKTVPDFLNLKDFNQLFAYFSEKTNTLIGLRNFIVFLIFGVTGIRISSLRGLNVNDFDHVSGLLFIHEKGGRKRQMVLPEALCLLLQEYILLLTRKSGPLFLSKRGKCISERTLQSIFRKALVDLRIHKDFHVHLFRHTAGTLLAKVAGLSITQHVLGHDVRRNTEIYVHLNPDQFAVHMRKHPYMKYVKGGC